MEFLNAVEKSEFILVEGAKKTGKLMFSLFTASKEKKEKILLFSTYSQNILNKRLEAIKYQNIKSINDTIEKTKILTMKEEWTSIKSSYEIEYLIKDIHKAIEKEKPDFIIFHRFDLFFDPHETSSLKYFIEKLLDTKTSNNIKLIFTSDISSVNREIIENIENFSDINILIEKYDEKRVLKIKNTIFPVKYDICEFLIFNNDIKILPAPGKTNREIIEKKLLSEKRPEILIISKNDKLIKLLTYILKPSVFNIDIAKNTSEIINKILHNPDIVLYNPFENSLDFSVCHTIKQQNLKSKLIYITNETYIRGDDKITAINNGCFDVFPINFNILELLSEIEKIINLNFYTYNITKLKISHTIENKKTFCNILKSLQDEKIFFSLVIFKTSEKIDMHLLRNHDFLYEDGEMKYLILLNTLKENIDIVMKKLFPNNSFKIEYENEAYDVKYEEFCK